MRSILPTSGNTSTASGKKVFVGISGGVDSGLSAALLKRQGYDVTGVFIKIAISGYPCPAGEDRLEAMRVAAHLKIPFIEIDLSKEYEKEIFRPAIASFAAGITPNPDTLCNEKIKFGHFYAFARAQGAQYVATGHYAQTHSGNLYKGADENKDQSYFLYGVPMDALSHTIFPVGNMHKEEVRRLASTFGLPNAARKDSQGLCFLGDISLSDMLARELDEKEGLVLSEIGEVVGRHRGAHFYTLGQRHGFDRIVDTPQGSPQYVIAKDVKMNTITVSRSKYPLNVTGTVITLKNCNWIGRVENGEYEARYRYRGELIPCTLLLQEKGTRVVLKAPQYVPQGQALVLYNNERCLGGGIIESATLNA